MVFLDPFFLRTSLPPLAERTAGGSSVEGALRRIEKHKERVAADFRDAVSGRFKYAENHLQELQSFAERLIRENEQKQAKPEIVARNVRRTNNWIARNVGAAALRPARPQRTKTFETAWVDTRRASDNPRTVFGTEAWIGSKLLHAAHLNPRFVTRHIALPCVERSVRKEVLFAKGHGGKGHRTRHHRKQYSHIGC